MSRKKKQRIGPIALFWMVMCILLSVCGCMRGNVSTGSESYRIIYTTDRGIFTINSDGSDTRKIADEGKGIVVSPDGSRILYKTETTLEDGELHCVNIDGSGSIVLAKLDYCSYVEYEFSPDGSQVLYEAGSKVYLINSDGTGQFLLASGSHSTFSADGTRVYYVDAHEEKAENGLMKQIVDDGFCSICLDGTDKNALLDSALLAQSSWVPIYSPDKSRVLIPFSSSGNLSCDSARIFDGKGQLSEIIYTHIDVYDTDMGILFSPDGSSLLSCDDSYMADRFFLSDSDGKNVRYFSLSTEKITNIYDPAFSPDSKSFVFCAWTEWNLGNHDISSISGDSFSKSIIRSNAQGVGERNIYVNPVEGYDPKCLTSGIFARSPMYTPDGSEIVYIVAERTGNNPDDYQEFICIMNADGSDQKQIICAGKIEEMYVITSNA